MRFDDLDIAALRQRHGKKWSTYGESVLPAWVADMDFPIPEPIRAVLDRALQRSDYGYPHDGLPQGVREAFAGRMLERYRWRVEPERVEVVGDVVQAIYIALEVYSAPGEGAIIQTPIYPPFLTAVREVGRPAVFNRLRRGAAHYEIDFDALGACARPDTRLFLLCNPHNPTGRVLTRGELEGIAEVALAHDLIVVADEIHADLVFDGRRHIPFATLGPEIEARTVTLGSASKAFNIAGLRCAVAAFGSEALQARFLRIPRHLRGGLSPLGMSATRTAWEECGEWLDALLPYLQGNRDATARFLDERLPAISHFPPQATYLYWLDCRALGRNESPYRFFLERARVALSNGADFGEGGIGFVRLNLATSRGILREILARMAEAVASLERE